MLRGAFKKQQERCIKFLELSEDYANKYLLEVDAEIRQQSTLLDNLEERLEGARKLHRVAAHLQTSYETETVTPINDIRATGEAAIRCMQRLQGNLLTLLMSRYFAAASTGRCTVQRG